MSKRVESFVHAQIRKTIEKYFRYGKFHVFTSEASLKFKELMMRDCQIQMRIPLQRMKPNHLVEMRFET